MKRSDIIHAALMTVCMIVIMFASTADAHARSYNGTWKAEDGWVVAKVQKKQITITLKGDDGTRALYWKGSFTGKGNVVISKADTEALEFALFGSTDKHKGFRYTNGALQFRMSMFGVTKTISLWKV